MHDAPSDMLPPRSSGARLEYVRSRLLPGRPAVLSVVVAASVVVGALGFGLSLLGTVFFGGLWLFEPAPVSVSRAAPLAAANVLPYDGDPAGIDGLKKAQRRAVVEHLRERMNLWPDRAEMLDRLLSDVGRRIFPQGARLDPFDADLIKSYGLPAEAVDANASREPQFFITSRGRVELDDFTATVTLDGAKPVQVMRNVFYDGDRSPRWSAIAIGRYLDELHARSPDGAKLSALQAAALLRELGRESPTSHRSWEIRPQVLDPIWWEGGLLSYHPMPWDPTAKRMWLLQDGRMTTVSSAPLGIDPVTGAPYSPQSSHVYLYFPGSRASFLWLGISSALQMMLSAYLFCGAILLLRNPAEGALRHARYIGLTPVLSVLTLFGAAWWVMSVSEYPSVPLLEVQPRWTIVPTLALLMLIYPALLLLVFRGVKVRRYFAMHGQDPWFDFRQISKRIRESSQTRLGRRMIAWTGVAMLGIAMLHGLVAFSRLSEAPDEPLAVVLHAIAAATCIITGVLLRRAAGNGSSAARVAVMSMMLMMCGAAQPEAMKLSPWEVQGLLTRARDADLQEAEQAIRRLARSHEVGQPALLQLLEEQEPPIGVGGVLRIVGSEWQDRRVRWAPQHRARALRMSLEWIEYIRYTDDAASMVVIEAIGPIAEMEPLLRPLLVAQNDGVRNRATALLLQINPHPAGIIRLLGRDALEGSADSSRRAVSALANLRPLSDAMLARALREGNGTLKMQALRALEPTLERLGEELLDAVESASLEDDAQMSRLATTVLAHRAEGRDRLIRRILQQPVGSELARAALLNQWPNAEAVFWRLEASPPYDLRQQIRTAAGRMLDALNQIDSEARLLQHTFDKDEETRAQARLVLSAREYSTKLGPATYALVEPHLRPEIAGLQSSPTDWHFPATGMTLQSSPAPDGAQGLDLVWVTRVLWAGTVLSPAILGLLLYLRRSGPVYH